MRQAHLWDRNKKPMIHQSRHKFYRKHHSFHSSGFRVPVQLYFLCALLGHIVVRRCLVKLPHIINYCHHGIWVND